jgi:hypothetical protein
MLIAQAFPPKAVVGAHRMLAFCRHLVEQQYQVSIITSHPAQDAAVDESLARTIPAEVKVISAAGIDLPLLAARILKPRFLKKLRGKKSEPLPSVPKQSEGKKQTGPAGFRFIIDWLSWWLHIPDGSTGWLPPALLSGLYQAARNRPDVIFSSGPPWSSFLAGALLSRFLGVPLVSDFRDPWCGSAFLRVPYSAHDSVNTLLEKMVVRRSRRIICAWDGIRKHLIRRYPKRRNDICTIINGFNPELLAGIEPASLDSERKVFLHTGGFYGPRSPEPMLAALQHLKEQSPESASRILVVFLGPTTYNGRPIEQMAQTYGVQDYLRILPRVSHRKSLGYLKGADSALLFGQSGNEALATIPAKTLEYIGLKKPVIAIGAGEEVCDVIRRGGCPIWRIPADDPAQIASSMTDILKSDFSDTDQKFFCPNDRDSLTQAHMSQQLERVLLSCCS